jgi:hypothetical protein
MPAHRIVESSGACGQHHHTFWLANRHCSQRSQAALHMTFTNKNKIILIHRHTKVHTAVSVHSQRPCKQAVKYLAAMETAHITQHRSSPPTDLRYRHRSTASCHSYLRIVGGAAPWLGQFPLRPTGAAKACAGPESRRLHSVRPPVREPFRRMKRLR